MLHSYIFVPSVVKYDILSYNRCTKLHAVIECLFFASCRRTLTISRELGDKAIEAQVLEFSSVCLQQKLKKISHNCWVSLPIGASFTRRVLKLPAFRVDSSIFFSF